MFIGLLRLEKEKDCQKATDAATYFKVYACSDIDLGEVLFNYVIFYGKENRDLSS